jgi:hypothetical protein
MLFAIEARAQAPALINYQAKLISGTNLYNGTATVIFSLHSLESGGTRYFAETQKVTVVDGLYSALIGASNAIPGALRSALANSPVWLQVTVDGTALAPRERVASVTDP